MGRTDPVDGPSWSDIAVWYDDLVTSGSGPHDTAARCLIELLPAVEGAAVLDLACGQGLATRAIAELGPRHVVGIDSSPAMIALARTHPVPGGVEVSYRVDDAQALTSLAASSFDGATCQLGLMDIPDLDSTLAAVTRILRPDGWFVFVIGHPCFLVPDSARTTVGSGQPAVTVTGYFTERFWRSSNPEGVRRAGNYHRPLSTYLNAVTRAGLVTEEVAEPMASDLLQEQQPLYGEVPMFFAARARFPAPR